MSAPGACRPSPTPPATLAERLVDLLVRRGLTVATCESLTAGLVAARIADVPGCSAALRGGLVTYATDLKVTLAGVPRDDTGAGVVTQGVAEAMARGAAAACRADVGLATTGVAGPGPADGVPAGTCWVAVAHPGGGASRRLALPGGRGEVREGAVAAVLELALEQLSRRG